MDNEYTYDAFISYRHLKLDKAIADKLQKMLESYVPPSATRERKEFKKLHIFRDETELPTSSNLSEDIRNALGKSRFLIVICSKAFAQSKWCMEEVTYFKELHGGSTSNILTLLIEGDPSEVFPPELCMETRTITEEDGSTRTEVIDIEPLAANVVAPTEKESIKKLKREYLRIAAPLIGCSFDTLYNRNQRRFIRRIIAVSTAIVLFLIAFGIYSSAMIYQINDSLSYAKSLLLLNGIEYAGELNQQGARSRAAAILLKAYENIDVKREGADLSFNKFRDTVINTMYYYDEAMPFARIDLREEIIKTQIAPNQYFAVITTEKMLYKIDIDTGNIVGTYEVPEGEKFIDSGIFEVCVYAVTTGGRVMIVNTESNEKVISDSSVRYYEEDTIETIAYNDKTSSIIVLTYFTRRHGLYQEMPDSDTYIMGDDNELYTKLILTVIPCDIESLQIHTDDKQTITYKNDDYLAGLNERSFSFSENGRFLAFSDNRESSIMDGTYESKYIRSEINIIDFDRFDNARSPADNKINMMETIDFGPADEANFLVIDRFYISNNGFLCLDAKAYWDNDNWDRKTIAYDFINDTEVFNGNFTNETSRMYLSRYIPINNQYNFDMNVHWWRDEEGVAAIDIEHPDYLKWLEEMSEKEATFFDIINYTYKSDDYIVFLDSQEEYTHLKVLHWETGELKEYNLPKNYDIKHCFVYDEGWQKTMRIVLIGTVLGQSRNYILGRDDTVTELQTLDVMSTAGAFDLGCDKLVVGYKDGTVLMFNKGASPLQAFGTTYSVVYLSGEVYLDNKNTGIVLKSVLGNGSFDIVSYNKNRNLMFGYEDDYENDRRVYSIWNSENGDIIKSFYSEDYVAESRYWEMQINSDFTYAIFVDKTDSYNQIDYYVLDVSTGEILYTHHRAGRDSIFSFEERSFYGIGSEPNMIWFFHTDILLLEEVDVSTGEIMNSYYITERLRPSSNSIFEFGASYSKVYYEFDNDIIIFKGSEDAVYSLSSGKMIFTGLIYQVEYDCSAIYLMSGGGRYERIDLSPEALYETLKQFTYVGVMSEEDIGVTGFDILD